MKKFEWTPERVETLKQLWAGGRSGQQIAESLGNGATRNGVIGKAHRLGLKDKRATPQTPRAEWHSSEAVTAVLKNRSGCVFPLGDPKQPDFHFCGRPAEESRPYCALHCEVAYRRKGEPFDKNEKSEYVEP